MRTGPKYRASRVRELTDLERAWVAGLLEGEGSFGVARGDKLSWITCGMTDRDVVEHLAEVVGTGNVREVKPRQRPEGTPHQNKSVWVWTLMARSDVESLSTQIYDLLGARRRAKIEEIWDLFIRQDTDTRNHGPAQGRAA